jgi:hypothetical protein
MKGTNINILNVMGKEHDEVIICKLLAFLLNPNEKHGQGNYFLDIFLQSIKEQKIEEDEIFSVITEFPTDESRRIDIVLKSNKRFLPFEVKINAGDQDEQCIHYYNYSKNQGFSLSFRPPSSRLYAWAYRNSYGSSRGIAYDDCRCLIVKYKKDDKGQRACPKARRN